MRIATAFLLLGAVPQAISAAGPMNSSVAVERLNPADIKAISDEAERLSKLEIFSGTVLIARRSEPVFQNFYGQADKGLRIPNGPRTQFNVGSVTKMFTAVAIGRLYDRGQLDLDDTVDKYLGAEWLSPDVAKKITVKQLLAHRSGLGDYLTPAMREASRLRFRTVNDFQPWVRDSVPEFTPGTGNRYSNIGYVLLGAIIEKVTGRSYFDHIVSDIAVPLGMTRTRFYDPEDDIAERAIGYFKEGELTGGAIRPGLAPGAEQRLAAVRLGPEPWRHNAHRAATHRSPAGGLYSTGGDLIRFAEALRADRLLKRKTRELFWTPLQDEPPYGLGFGNDQGVVGHNGGAIGVNAVVSIYTKSDLNVVVLSNYHSGAVMLGQFIRTRIEGSGKAP